MAEKMKRWNWLLILDTYLNTQIVFCTSNIDRKLCQVKTPSIMAEPRWLCVCEQGVLDVQFYETCAIFLSYHHNDAVITRLDNLSYSTRIVNFPLRILTDQCNTYNLALGNALSLVCCSISPSGEENAIWHPHTIGWSTMLEFTITGCVQHGWILKVHLNLPIQCSLSIYCSFSAIRISTTLDIVEREKTHRRALSEMLYSCEEQILFIFS